MPQFTQREFLFLDDIMHATEVESKCSADMAGRCTEPAVRDLCLRLSQMHRRHFDRLLRHMNAGQGQAATQPQWAAAQMPPYQAQPTTYTGQP